jgi:hypothetical protein
LPTCSLDVQRPARPGSLTPAIASRSVGLSASTGCSERRSNDGRLILEAPSVGQESRLDLLVCGAPLRNRTVDLLLTMGHQPVTVPAI